MEIPPKTRPRLFLIDAYALIYRSYFAFIQRPLTNSRGENTSAPFGFANFLERVRDELQPDYLAVVFDSGMSFREEVYPEYKATREKMPDELRASLPRIRDILEAYLDPVVELEGYEADDVIGTLARKAEAEGLEAVVVSGDKDFYQLVGPGIRLLNPGRGGPTGVDAEWVDEENARDKFGVSPGQVIDYLALIGDSSDNVPGAPGVGPKTAVTLLQEFGSLDAAIDRAEEIRGKRAREALTEHVDEVRLSKRLVTIITDLPVELDLERLRVHEPDAVRLRDLYVDLEFRALAEKYTKLAMEEGADAGAAEAVREYRTVTKPEELRELVDTARSSGRVSIRAETARRDPMRSRLVGLGLSVEPGHACYLPLAHTASEGLELEFEPRTVPAAPALTDPRMAPLLDLFRDPEVLLVGHDIKATLITLAEAGLEVAGPLYDTMVASYVLDPGRRDHGLEALAVEMIAYRPIPYKEMVGSGKSRISFAEVDVDRATEYVGELVDLTLRLFEETAPRLDGQALRPLFDELEMPLVPVLARMERAGVLIDPGFFLAMSRRLNSELQQLQEQVHELAGGDFNLNSTQQLREVLFERLDLPVIKKTKTGPSTDASVLEELAGQGHEMPRLLLEYRELEKLRSTYVDALPRLVHPRTGRIHTSFNQAVAATGRLSSSDPNLQNIPIRTPLGREVRKGFVAGDGRLLLGVDYSQVELRILAHFSGDDAFVTAFKEGIDVHVQTASVIFDVPVGEVTPIMRGQAKTINFATLYGQGPFSLAAQLGISREDAKAFIEQYFERFSGVRRYLDEQVAQAKEKGYVETLLGRRRYIPELKSGNWNIRQFGERVAQNTPIQGTAADLIKKAMIEIDGFLPGPTGGRMLLQVHDELLFEVPTDSADELEEAVVAAMEGALELAVPLVAEAGRGRTWYQAK